MASWVAGDGVFRSAVDGGSERFVSGNDDFGSTVQPARNMAFNGNSGADGLHLADRRLRLILTGNTAAPTATCGRGGSGSA